MIKHVIIYCCQSVSEEVTFFSGILRWLWLIFANSLRVVGGLLREPDSLGRAIDIWDLGGVVHAIDNGAFLRGYADPFLRLVLYRDISLSIFNYDLFYSFCNICSRGTPFAKPSFYTKIKRYLCFRTEAVSDSS